MLNKNTVILAALLSVPFLANAGSSITEVGRLEASSGTDVTFYISDRDGEKRVFISTRGEYGIKRASAFLNKAKAKSYRMMLDKAISEID